MTGLPIFALAVRSILNRRMTALLTIMTVAISVTLFLGVEKVRHGARTSFENTISGTDLIVGARSGPVNLLLYTIFHIGDPTNAISWDSYQAVSRAPGVAWTVPISLGDSHRGFRVVGTDNGFFEHYRYANRRALRLAEGEALGDLHDSVIGAAVARELGYQVGDPIIIAHGTGSVSFIEHDHAPFNISGILAPTGTPVDRSVFVSLEAIEAIHLDTPYGSPGAERTPDTQPAVDATTTDHPAHDHSHEHDTAKHEDHSDAAHAHEPGEASAPAETLTPNQITAFLVGLDSPVTALRLQRQINTYPEEALQAILPGVALIQLWSVIGAAERTLAAIAAFVVLAGLVSILTAILTSLNERRREMAILRALGARPHHIFTLLVSEAALLALAGAVVGTGLTYAGLAVAAPLLETRYGIVLAAGLPGLTDLAVIGCVTLAAALLGALPAWRALRNSLADGMTPRI